MDIILPKIVSIGYYNTDIVIKNKNMDITKNRNVTMFEIEIPDIYGGVSYVDSLSHSIIPNMIICAKPGQIRRTRLPFKCYFIHIVVEKGILHDMLINIPTFFEPVKIVEYRRIFKKLYKYYENSTDVDNVILQSLILELIYKLYNDTKCLENDNVRESANREIINKAVQYIDDNLTNTLSLEELSKFVGFSPIYFHNMFKTSTGLTLHQYVEILRIKKASTLLVTTNMTLAQIALECGFSSQSYFNFAFKRKMKMTPREYVKVSNNRYISNTKD